jgi:3',5'-cyclic-AMP phosphodiesterase
MYRSGRRDVDRQMLGSCSTSKPIGGRFGWYKPHPEQLGIRMAGLERLKLIVLTDIHMTPDGETILGIDPQARLAAALVDIRRYHSDADRLILSGDLTHYGDRIAYEQLRMGLAEVTTPITILLGNHDRRDAFREAFPDVLTDAHGFVQSVHDHGTVRLICLDTLHGPPYDHHEIHSGALCRQRLAWLDAALDLPAERRAIIFMHHPPHAVGFRGMDRIRLKDGAAFFEIVRRRGNVRHIVAGHIHRTISGSVHGIPFSIFKSPVHQQPMTFDSEDTSLSVAEPAAYGIIFITQDSILVHSEDYQISAPVT